MQCRKAVDLPAFSDAGLSGCNACALPGDGRGASISNDADDRHPAKRKSGLSPALPDPLCLSCD
jgi:hypothetical protein